MMAVSVDDLMALATFARIAEHRSFTAAAKALGVSKSTASARLSSLEQRLQVRLLRRTTRCLSLTHEGERLYERCTQFLSAADGALSDMYSATTVAEGLLRVAAPVGFGIFQLTPVLGDFSARYPRITLELLLSDRVVHFVEERLDVAIRIARRLDDAMLVARKIGRERFVVCASPSYFDRYGRPSRPEDLARHNCLRRQATDVAWEFASGRRRVCVPISGRLIADDVVLLRQALLDGIGVARMPHTLVARDIAAGRLATALDHYAQDEASIFAVLSAHTNQPAKIRAFVEFVAKLLAQDGATAPVASSPPARSGQRARSRR